MDGVGRCPALGQIVAVKALEEGDALLRLRIAYVGSQDFLHINLLAIHNVRIVGMREEFAYLCIQRTRRKLFTGDNVIDVRLAFQVSLTVEVLFLPLAQIR